MNKNQLVMMYQPRLRSLLRKRLAQYEIPFTVLSQIEEDLEGCLLPIPNQPEHFQNETKIGWRWVALYGTKRGLKDGDVVRAVRFIGKPKRIQAEDESEEEIIPWKIS